MITLNEGFKMDYDHRKLQERYENNPTVFNEEWLEREIDYDKRMIDISKERLKDAQGCLRAKINALKTLKAKKKEEKV